MKLRRLARGQINAVQLRRNDFESGGLIQTSERWNFTLKKVETLGIILSITLFLGVGTFPKDLE